MAFIISEPCIYAAGPDTQLCLRAQTPFITAATTVSYRWPWEKNENEEFMIDFALLKPAPRDTVQRSGLMQATTPQPWNTAFFLLPFKGKGFSGFQIQIVCSLICQKNVFAKNENHACPELHTQKAF